MLGHEREASLPALDIHGGGQDLVFPHPENEIAQSEAATGQQFARYWIHNGFVQIDSEKMSKSLGNFKTIRDILGDYLPETLRFFLLGRHYRSPVDFTFEAMDEVEKNLKRIYAAKAQLEIELGRTNWSKGDLHAELDELATGWSQAMHDDLNTAAALGYVFGLIRLVNRVLENKGWRKSAGGRACFERALSLLDHWGRVLGLFQAPGQAFLDALRDAQIRRRKLDPGHIDALVARRQEAKKNKDFATADALRDELVALGVELRDTPTGPVWDVA